MCKINNLHDFGVGFTVNQEDMLECQKEYTMTLKADAPGKSIEIEFTIVIIEITEDNGKRKCRALYRDMTEEQLAALEEILLAQPKKLYASIA